MTQYRDRIIVALYLLGVLLVAVAAALVFVPAGLAVPGVAALWAAWTLDGQQLGGQS